MKKSPQRLTLSRETLGHLERAQLETAAGASGPPGVLHHHGELPASSSERRRRGDLPLLDG